ncbi:MAG: transketolase C-terminal domain-containing protein [Pseudomonadales bacterium]
MSRIINYVQATNEALQEALRQDPNVICYGLGADDPRGIFGTTLGLQEEFGAERVFDMPTSENAMTGIGIGASLNGIRPVMTHQRLDFFLLAMDQLVNNAAKWRYMFGGRFSVPITIRLIIGRGWGQGPTHSQSLQSWFAHIPGLRVVMPSNARDAKGLLLESIFCDDPVVILEHRWLHNSTAEVPEGDFRVPLGKADVIVEGDALTVVSMSYLTVEARLAVAAFQEQEVNIELLDLRTIAPIDWSAIYKSVNKTGRLLVLDTGVKTCSVAGEIIASVVENCWSALKQPPVRMTMPDIPEPTSFGLTKNFYIRAETIAERIAKIIDCSMENIALPVEAEFHDVPGDWFKGPF